MRDILEKEYTIYSKLQSKNENGTENLEDIVPNDVVYLSSDTYIKIFGRKIKETENLPWKRGIVKISYYDDVTMTHKTIYRLWRGLNPNYRSKDLAYIDVIGQSILFGLKSDGKVKALELSKGSKFMFYWQHSNSVVRSSFKLGVLSVALGFLSIVFGVVSLFV